MKILVYGDSFACPGVSESSPGWTDMISKKMGLQILNRAVGGGSTENAALNFFEDFKNNVLEDDDIIIFLKSTPGRLTLLHQRERPETASQFLHSELVDENYHTWYRDNKKHIKWYIRNKDDGISQIAHESIIHVLINYARVNPRTKILFLHNMRDHCYFMPRPELTPNFLEPDICINTASKNEFQDGINYWDFIRYTIYDPRFNHYCIPNLEILSDLAKETLTTGEIKNFTYDRFERNIYGSIKTVEEFDYWVKKNYFYDSTAIREHFRRKRVLGIF